MISIIRTLPVGSPISTFLDTSVILRDNNKNVDGCPDISFSIRTYEKIARGDEITGDQILLPINLFFETLTVSDHRDLYEMYRFARKAIGSMNIENRREIQDAIQQKVFDTSRRINLPAKMIEFCKTPRFEYPPLNDVGREPHHTSEKTFELEHYIELTGISIFSKMMVPIWGELVKVLGDIGILSNQREKIAFDLIEPTLEESAFERIYMKLSNILSGRIGDLRKAIDNKPMGNASTSFILTHNGLDDQMFDSIVMATIVMKRMSTYECFARLKDGGVPNAMVYIDDGINKTADTRIKAMRKETNTMPRKELPNFDTEDNSSILDHASKTSKRSIDIPIVVNVTVAEWEIPRLLVETNTPMDVYTSAVSYYENNYFDVSPLCQSVVASFVGTRFGGSKCLNDLSAQLYQKVVVILQIFLIRNGMIDLARMITSNTSQVPLDGGNPSIGTRVMSNIKTAEYLQCLSLFRGFIRKPVNQVGKKANNRKQDTITINFENLISRLAEWLIMYSHTENMAPVLWDFTGVPDRPEVGSECVYDENLIRTLCGFYLLMHSGDKPF